MSDKKVVMLLGVLAALAVGAFLVLNELSGASVEPGRPRPPGPREGRPEVPPAPPPQDWERVNVPRGEVYRTGPAGGAPGVPAGQDPEDWTLTLERAGALIARAGAGDDGAWRELERLMKSGLVGDWMGLEALLLGAFRDGVHNAQQFLPRLLFVIRDPAAKEKAVADLLLLAGEVPDDVMLPGVFDALGQIGGEDAVAEVARLARAAKSSSAFAPAVRALALIGGARAAEELSTLLAEQARLDPGNAQASARRSALLQAVAQMGSEEMARALVPMLGEGRLPEEQALAIEALGVAGSGAALEPLRGFARAEGASAELRLAAVASIGKLGTKDAAEELLAIRAGGGDLGLAAGLALQEIGDPAAADTIFAAYEREEVEAVKAAMVRSLGNMGDPKAVPGLTSVLGAEAEPAFLRGAAARALGEIGDPASVGPLVDVLETSPDDALFLSATLGLRAMTRNRETHQQLVEVARPRLEKLLESLPRDQAAYYRLKPLVDILDVAALRAVKRR